MWRWRHARRSLSRTLPWVLLATGYMLLVAAISVFVGLLLSTTSGTRLIRGQGQCGFVTTQAVAPFYRYYENAIEASASYAQSCYYSTAPNLGCGIYVQRALPYITDTTAECPFADEACLMGQGTALRMDTGPLDSAEDFGINTGDSDRASVRKVTTCAPVVIKDDNLETVFLTNDNEPYGDAGDEIKELFFGPSPPYKFTYPYNTHGIVDEQGYDLVTYFAQIAGEDGQYESFKPIPELNRTDADVTLMFLSGNAMLYRYEVSDPWFNATDLVSEGFYKPTLYVGVMGCTEQYQICNPNNGMCGDLSGEKTLHDESYITNIGMQGQQLHTASRLIDILGTTSLIATVGERGPDALLAQSTVFNNLLQFGELPDDQWVIEQRNWFNTSLALMQSQVVSYATGVTTNTGVTYEPLPGNAQCDAQKVTITEGTVNYSVLGMSLVLILGVIVILISFIQTSVVRSVRRRMFHGSMWRSIQWSLDRYLVLQAMLYEALGMSSDWQKIHTSVPIPVKTEALHGNINEMVDRCPRLAPFVNAYGRPTDNTGVNDRYEMQQQETSYDYETAARIEESKPFVNSSVSHA